MMTITSCTLYPSLLPFLNHEHRDQLSAFQELSSDKIHVLRTQTDEILHNSSELLSLNKARKVAITCF
jgi:hypothetical protein